MRSIVCFFFCFHSSEHDTVSRAQNEQKKMRWMNVENLSHDRCWLFLHSSVETPTHLRLTSLAAWDLNSPLKANNERRWSLKCDVWPKRAVITRKHLSNIVNTFCALHHTLGGWVFFFFINLKLRRHILCKNYFLSEVQAHTRWQWNMMNSLQKEKKFHRPWAHFTQHLLNIIPEFWHIISLLV